jgi:hypothetical protein
MVYQAVKGAFLIGKIPVESFPGYLKAVAQVSNADLIMGNRLHHFQQAQLQLALSGSGLFRFAKFVHKNTSIHAFIITNIKNQSTTFVNFANFSSIFS